jgi:hypothetical protein
MQLESIDLVLRPRTPWEGCDLGTRLLQSRLRWVYSSYLAVALPWFALALSLSGIAAWLPALLIWLSKPWLDRTLLFALSRAMFGESTTPRDVWRAQRHVLWSKLGATLTLRRLSMSRSFTQPIVQLEGLSGAPLRARLRQVADRRRSVARAATLAFLAAELALVASILSLQAWLAPHHGALQLNSLMPLSASAEGVIITMAYAAAVAFVEPFYVAAGFGMYVNRRVELEAWDIEQEFRRAFAA